jgi:hypothetical protein
MNFKTMDEVAGDFAKNGTLRRILMITHRGVFSLGGLRILKSRDINLVGKGRFEG